MKSHSTYNDRQVLEKSSLDKAFTLENLKSLLSDIFMDAQKPAALLRVDAITLRDIQLACCLNAPRCVGQAEDIDYSGESRFLKLVFNMMNVVIRAKRRDAAADRVQRFIAAFIQYIQAKDEEAFTKGGEDEEEEEESETITARFVENFLRHLFRGFIDKKASVRFRCCQMLALSISSMGELDEELYQELRTHLIEAYFDKEAAVRAQACIALCRLQGDSEVDITDGRTVQDKLIWSVRHDPSPEVRRLILFNIEMTPETTPHIVRCTRDPDSINRKIVYLRPLSSIRDFSILSFEEKLIILEWGLNDRNDHVQKAAYKMFSEKWISHAHHNLLDFLEKLEATHSGMTKLVEKLLGKLFKDRKDIVDGIEFDDEFWSNLSGESALLAKVTIEHVSSNQDSDERLDMLLPEVTRHVYYLGDYYGLYRASLNDEANGAYEFIFNQLLDISLCLDYADELGRRKMFEFLRNSMRSHTMIDAHLEKVVKILKMISIDEKDFTRTIIEVMSDIQDGVKDRFNIENDKPLKRLKLNDNTKEFLYTQNESQEEEDNEQLRCLKICKFMLENSFEPLVENANLYGLLNDSIVPAVESLDLLIRGEGLNCLGLCCLLDKSLAQHNVVLFIACIKTRYDEIGKKAIKALGDIILMYGIDAMSDQLTSPEEVRYVFEYGLDHEDPEFQVTTVQIICKLMLFNRYEENELLRLMILLYFFPKSSSNDCNNKIFQCLSYFFPAYSYSSLHHQKTLADVTIPALEELCDVFNDLGENETMINPKQISEILADWNDPRKLVKKGTTVSENIDESYETPGTLAIETLQIICNEEEGLKRRIMCNFLFRLYLDKASKDQLIEIKEWMNLANEEDFIKQIPIKKAMEKLTQSIDKLLQSYTDSDNNSNDDQQSSISVTSAKNTKEEKKTISGNKNIMKVSRAGLGSRAKIQKKHVEAEQSNASQESEIDELDSSESSGHISDED